jgi:hypothetical protein
LKPLKISQTANTISCKKIGPSIATTVEDGRSTPDINKRRAVRMDAAARKPKAEIHRGTSLVQNNA